MNRPKEAVADFRYLPVEPEDQVWGIFLRDVGEARIPRNSVYPPEGHPTGYQFDWAQGRVLQEYQIIYIRAGRGVLETRSGGKHSIKAGQAFVLFPGEWHRYRPSAASGWWEAWVGFTGEYVGHLMRNFFSPTDPVLTPVAPGALLTLWRRLEACSRERAFRAGRSKLRTRLLEFIAGLHEGYSPSETRGQVTRIETARLEILTRAADRINWREMAARYGMSYATFRRRFGEMTGRSPLDYQIQVRLNRAAEMLRHSNVSAREVADRLGYTHVHFFSRQFKNRFGSSPVHYRAKISSGAVAS